MLSLLRSYLGDRSGNFAVVFGISLLPLLGAVGLAVDYTRVLHARSVLLGAADAAAAGAVSQASPTYRNGGVFNQTWTVGQAKQDALNLFEANLVNNVDYTLENVTADITQSGRRLEAKVDFSAQVPMTFMKMFGHTSVTVTGEAQAAVDTAPFIDFYLLLDNSPSMGLAATPTDISRMESLTSDKCAFACHTTNDAKNNTYAVAKANNVTLRIDVVRQAAQSLFDKAKDVKIHDQQFRMGLFTFGPKAESIGLTEIASLSPNFDQGKAKAASVDLMTIPNQNYDNDQQSPFDVIFTGANSKIDTPGDGSGPSQRQKVLFYVSDGVADHAKSSCTKKKSGQRCQEPIDPKICESIKARGIQIAVLYTTYQPVTNNAWYNTWISPFQSEIATNMQKCATPGYFFEVSPSQGIVEALQALFMKVVGNPRITG